MTLGLDTLIGQTCLIPIASATARPTILVIDDDPDSALLATYVLEALDYRCLCASTAVQGLALAVVHVPDLILLDIWLPDYSGIEVFEHLRHHAQTAAIPVIAVTALAQSSDRDQLLQLGCTGYISKPYLIDELRTLVQQSLNRRPSSRLRRGKHHNNAGTVRLKAGAAE